MNYTAYYDSTNTNNNKNFQNKKHLKAFFTNLYRQISIESNVETTHNNIDVRNNSTKISTSVVIEKQGGMKNKYVIFLLIAWYFFSAITLYTNKYIISTRNIDPKLIGTFQMLITSAFCLIQMKYNQTKNRVYDAQNLLGPDLSDSNVNYKSPRFIGNMLIIGFLRLFSIILGLMALQHASISFVETIKSSSPLFTAIISNILIGEVTGYWTKISLLPIMIGLALCSSFELNFNLFGFFAAILTNITECIQNVFSKLLLCSERDKFTPLEIQFFTSLSSIMVLVPLCFFTVEYWNEQNFDLLSLFIYFLNGFSFNCQSFLAFILMSYISPVTYSVCNTVKRAVLIWFSVILFQNEVSAMSAFGTFVVIFGVLSYNQAKIYDNKIKLKHKDGQPIHKI